MTDLAPKPVSERRVLIVEDEHDLCELLSDVLGDAGFECTCTKTDEEAYAALRGGGAQFVCMVVDVNLGRGATGYDVARFGRQIDPALPVIYVSGQTSPESFKTNGVTGSLLVEKPFNADELMQQVHRLVGDNDDDE